MISYRNFNSIYLIFVTSHASDLDVCAFVNTLPLLLPNCANYFENWSTPTSI